MACSIALTLICVSHSGMQEHLVICVSHEDQLIYVSHSGMQTPLVICVSHSGMQ